jgi:ligand-binding sensor domain-containing protein/serine phosphatase RsbU (regulator of sigma subunit)
MRIGHYLLMLSLVIRITGLVTLIFFLNVRNLMSQKIYFEKYGVEQGLSSSKVYSILQDNDDHIWLGTGSGVSLFDGSGFRNYSAADGLAGGGVYSICNDSTGRVWLGHLNGGMSCFDDYKFKKIKFDSLQLNSDITSITQTGNHIWITTSQNGAIRISFPEKGDSVLTGRQYTGRNGLSDQVFNSFLSNDGEYFCIADAGIKKFNRHLNIFETHSPPGLPKFFSVIVMFEDSKGNYWYGTHNGGLYKQNKETGAMTIYDYRDGLSKNMISYITEDYKGDIWAGTWGGGITVFSGDKLKIFDRSNGLDALSIHCIKQDKEGNMIIADQDTGISVYKGDHFITYSDISILPDKTVFAICEDEKGRYWFGTNQGLSVYDPMAQGDKQVQFFNEAGNLIGNKIRFLKADRNGNIWIGTEGSGLFRYDIIKSRFEFDNHINGYLHPGKIITALELDMDGRLWIGNMDRLVMWDVVKHELNYYTQENGLAGSWISALFCDKDNNIWIGSERKQGLTKFNCETKQFSVINIGEGYIPVTISQTNDNTLWIGTTSGLLALKNDSTAIVLNTSGGLLSNDIKLLQPGDGGSLFIGTNFGLNRYNLSDSNVASFTKRAGFTGVEASRNASYKDSKGRLWFGTANGVTMLDQSLMPPVISEPLTHIKKIEVNYAFHEMNEGMRLDYGENSITFYYYSICLADPGSVKYKVMLKGADSDWHPATDQNFAIYPALRPGHYTFMVRASNNYGFWNEKPVEFSFIIKPPYYFSPWFISACSFILVLIIISYIKLRERNLIHEKKILEAKVEERTAEVVQKSHELEEKNRDITASIRYAERIQRAMLPMENIFDETFILFLPKDIVSGDFYWMYDDGDKQFIAAVDCTGHGVPGAFMSIIGHNSLNKIVREYRLTRPAAILNQLNKEVVKSLMHRDEKAVTDGMDLSLIAYDKEKFTLEFAGAYNPLYVVRDGQVMVYKGDRFPIGLPSAAQKRSFTNQTVDIKPGDMIYMCSDGYADQFGHADGKKFKTVNVKRIMSEICNLPICMQKEKLEKEIMEWKGDLPQVDDILFIGTRIPSN